MFMNEILQIWKLFFTKTNSHLLFIWAICHTANLIFVFMHKIMHKLWLLLCFHPQVRENKKYLFRMNAQFRANLVSYWCENDAKFRAKNVISCKNAKLLRKRIYCFVETLLLPWSYKFLQPLTGTITMQDIK